MFSVSGFFVSSLVVPSFIQCVALPLGPGQGSQWCQNLRNFKFKKRCSFSTTGVHEILVPIDASLLEAVWQASCMYCYHARSKDVMSPLLMSACGPGQWSCWPRRGGSIFWDRLDLQCGWIWTSNGHKQTISFAPIFLIPICNM